jgi:hypothetical protein
MKKDAKEISCPSLFLNLLSTAPFDFPLRPRSGQAQDKLRTGSAEGEVDSGVDLLYHRGSYAKAKPRPRSKHRRSLLIPL